jgi:RHS repeat-associated protein
LYNGGSELNPATGWYEMYYRDYDPALGRMMQIDPFATAYSTLSTYNYAANNPVMLNDPSGGYSREWWQEQQGTGMGAIGLPGFDQNGRMIVESTWDGSGGSPGSGGHWSDGIGYDDWTLYGGSPTYQANMALANQNPGRVYEAHGTFYERIDTYDDWYMLQSDGSWQFFESTFRSTRYERMAAQQGWFSDKQGEIIGMHWLNGSGKPLFFNDKSWTDYMESNSVIGGTIAGILHDDAMTRTQSGTHVQRIFVELAENDRSTGYGMLHGTLNFDYAFKATMINNKQIEYSCTFMWNDRIDPSTRQGDTPWVMAAKLRYSPADYDIIIKWTHTYIINK